MWEHIPKHEEKQKLTFSHYQSTILIMYQNFSVKLISFFLCFVEMYPFTVQLSTEAADYTAIGIFSSSNLAI